MTVKALIENVTGFEFESMTFMGNVRSLALKKKDGKMTVCSKAGMYPGDIIRNETIGEEEWNGFFNALFGKCGVMDYPEEFSGNMLIDGEHWSIDIRFRNQEPKHSEGNSYYPKNWDELMAVLGTAEKG